MKLALCLPFVLLLGLVIGGWAPKEELRASQKQVADLTAKLGDKSKDSRMDMFTSMVKIPERATKPVALSAAPKVTKTSHRYSLTNAAAAAVTSVATTNAVQKQPASEPPSKPALKPEDMRARIDEAKELWKTRVEVARAQWIDRLKLSQDKTALFDQSINSMNEQLYSSMQNLADQLQASDTLTPETGTRAFNEMTSALVQAYDDLGAIIPEEQRGEAAKMELTDFIDPAVAEPLIAVQDKLEKLPKDRPNRMRLLR